jgi:hypothetical protein
MELTQRILERLAAAPDQPTITIAVEPGDLPSGFSLPAWVARGAVVDTGRALVQAVADRPTVTLVRLMFPGARLPLDFPITPQN